MNTRNQLLAAHSVIPFCLLLGLGGFILPGWLPPPWPSLTPTELAAILSVDNNRLRVGITLMATGAPLFLLFSSAISRQMRRMEGPGHVLADVQIACATIGVVFIVIPAYMWLVVTYRPDTSKDIIVVFNDLAFFLLIAAFPPLVTQWLVLARSILCAPAERQLYPRWLGFALMWLALAEMPGLLIPFFRQGPFTYSGLFGFWMIVAGFGICMPLLWWYTVKAIKQEASGA